MAFHLCLCQNLKWKLHFRDPNTTKWQSWACRPARNTHIILLASNANKLFSNFCKLWLLINWPLIKQRASTQAFSKSTPFIVSESMSTSNQTYCQSQIRCQNSIIGITVSTISTWFWLRIPFPLQLMTPPSGSRGEP